MPKIAEDDVKRSGKGSKREPEGVPKVDKIDEKLEKNNPGRGAFETY